MLYGERKIVMKLINSEIEAKLLQKSLLDADEEGSNAKDIAKFFNPLGKVSDSRYDHNSCHLTG